jgi:small subunit ribosomal protein S20
MANTKSAAKRARQTERRTARNRAVTTGVKSQLKKTRSALTGGKDAAKAEFQKLSSVLDKAVKSGRIHRNAANRQKSAFNRKIAALS